MEINTITEGEKSASKTDVEGEPAPTKDKNQPDIKPHFRLSRKRTKTGCLSTSLQFLTMRDEDNSRKLTRINSLPETPYKMRRGATNVWELYEE
jgi:hypothetical protein